MKRALITGITGQDGSYLAEFLLGKGYEVHGIVRRTSTFNRGRIEHLRDGGEHASLHLHYGDLADTHSLLRAINEVQPQEVYNLAAQSHVAISFEKPDYTCDVTGLGTLRLLEAVRVSGLPIRFYQAGSSEMFGKVVETPQSETTPFHPRSPYACAKVFAHFITMNFRESYDLFACNGILFNHESPRRGENFVTRKITLSLARMLAGKQEVLKLGNLDAKRDWGYAKEYVEGMWLMLQQDKPDDYVLATGKTASVREFLEVCLHIAGIPFERIGEGKDEEYVDKRSGRAIVAIDPNYYRPAEVDLLVGDASKAKRVLGWEAQTGLEELAKIMMEADCRMIGASLAS